ncbi:hypothetical protein HS125_19415 [bacterium]|nr:hypothetical protein [bacterium]
MTETMPPLHDRRLPAQVPLLLAWSRWLVPVLVVVLIVAWAAGKRHAPFTPRTDNTLRRWLGADPDYLNPLLRTSADASYVQDYYNHNLLEWDYRHNRLIPRLITHYEISPDGLDYTLYLRKDVRWHDGERFDADDVLFSFRKSMELDVPGYARSGYVDGWIAETLPPDNGDGRVEAEEYLAIDWEALPELSQPAVMDGTPETEAALLAEESGLALWAARRDGRLYLSANRKPLHDLVVFLAREPGESVAYSPSSRVARWDAVLFVDSGNRYPFSDGWHATGPQSPAGATFAVSENAVEGMVQLSQLFPETTHFKLIACHVDDVRLEKLDDFTLRWHYPRRIYTNLQNCADLRLVAEHYYGDFSGPLAEHPRRDAPLGTGPYRFVSWERHTRVILERWDDYWGEVKPSIQRVEFKIITDPVVAFQAFRKGDVDAMSLGNPWTFWRAVAREDFQRHFYTRTFFSPGYVYIAWNNRRSFFSDPRCRRAMSYLFDAEDAVRHIYLGYARPITGPAFFKEPGYDDCLPPYRYDVERARALLDEAGWIDRDGDGVREKDLNNDGMIQREPLDGDPDRREVFEFDVLVSGAADAQNNWAALTMVRNCEKVGVRCRVRNVEFALWLDWVKKRNYDASFGQWLLGFESDPYEWFHSSQTLDGFNREQYADPDADRLLEAARAELDPEKRAELFRIVHRKLWEDQPYTFLLSPQRLWVFNRRVKDATAYDLFFDVLEWRLGRPEDEP